MDVKDLISKLTLEEKAALLSGKGEWDSRDIPRLGIDSIIFSDGPHGVRRQAGAGDHLGLNASLPATCFPTAATVASSWDEELGEKVGQALGQEANAQGVNVLLGPGLNMKRTPLCGRNFEYFAEDPYLAGKMSASYIRGIQTQGVYACPKHFAVNSRETRRMAMNAVVDERTMREVYLTAFEMAVKEGGAKCIMSSYNEVNGEYANENKHLLVDILRNEWGFDGIVVTDWGASNDHVKGVKCQSNVEMPNPGLDAAREIIKGVKDGDITMAEIDAAITPILEAVAYFKEQHKEAGIKKEEHHALAREAASKSAVLLKNEENVLPLKPGTKVAIVGDFALTPRYQGAGSSMVNSTELETIKDVLAKYDLEIVGIEQGYQRNSKALDHEASHRAVDLGEKADVVLYFFGLDEISESEGGDRLHMLIPSVQSDLMEMMRKKNPNIIGIMSAGSSVVMPWASNLKALLDVYLTGQAGATAILDIVTGKVNPSGKLAESYPYNYVDTPVFNYADETKRNLEYREGPFIGYRYYETAGVEVQFPFGHGLSYTSFEYSDIEANDKAVSFTVKNTGSVDGAEIAQLYIGLKGSKLIRPTKELKGFKKVYLGAGESQRITIELDDKAFRYFNVKTESWEREAGSYDIYVGASSADIRLTASVNVNGTSSEMPYDISKLPSYASGKITNVPTEEFTLLYGRELPTEHEGKLELNDAFCQLDKAKSGIFRLVYKVLDGKLKKAMASGTPDLNIMFIYNMPFRAISKMSGGMVSRDMAQGLVDAANGHFFGGVGRFIGGYFKNSKLNKQYEEKLK